MEVMEAREELEEASTQEECDAVRESNKGQSGLKHLYIRIRVLMLVLLQQRNRNRS
jgi:hypothetical protein